MIARGAPRNAVYYERMATRLTSRDLRDLWSRVRHYRSTPKWEPGKAFEYLIIRGFACEGAEVTWPYSVRTVDGIELEQIDGTVYCAGIACLIEAKAHAEALNYTPIAKLRAQLARRPATAIGAVFALDTGFTLPAKTLARHCSPQTVLLWEADEIAYALAKKHFIKSLVLKWRYAVEHGLPDFNVVALAGGL